MATPLARSNTATIDGRIILMVEALQLGGRDP
jgi:hypothetical protein